MFNFQTYFGEFSAKWVDCDLLQRFLDDNYGFAFMGVNYVLSSGSQFVIFNSSTIISQLHNQVHTCGHSQIIKQTQTGMKKIELN